MTCTSSITDSSAEEAASVASSVAASVISSVAAFKLGTVQSVRYSYATEAHEHTTGH